MESSDLHLHCAKRSAVQVSSPKEDCRWNSKVGRSFDRLGTTLRTLLSTLRLSG